MFFGRRRVGAGRATLNRTLLLALVVQALSAPATVFDNATTPLSKQSPQYLQKAGQLHTGRAEYGLAESDHASHRSLSDTDHSSAPRARHCALWDLFEQFGTDKGSRGGKGRQGHYYARAYCMLFEPRRESTKVVVELGFFRAAAEAAFATYFPNAEVYGLDKGGPMTKVKAVPKPGGPAGKMVPGAVLSPGAAMRPLNLGPRAEHVHLFVLNLNGLQHRGLMDKAREVGGAGVGLPAAGEVDIVIDDADHMVSTQVANFEVWWPRLRTGGLYIIEDIFVTPLPWDHGTSQKPHNRVPHNNSNCAPYCYFVQRPADHPFLSRQPPSMLQELEGREWYFAITGQHDSAGGLNLMMVIHK